jgi:hypothetical protein
VRTIAVAARFAQSKSAFIDMPGNSIIHTLFGSRADKRRAVVILRRRRRCRHPPPATSFPGGATSLESSFSANGAVVAPG